MLGELEEEIDAFIGLSWLVDLWPAVTYNNKCICQSEAKVSTEQTSDYILKLGKYRTAKMLMLCGPVNGGKSLHYITILENKVCIALHCIAWNYNLH